MQNENFQIISVSPKSRKKRLTEKLCSLIVYIALAVILILAIPLCLLFGSIIAVWSVTDKIVKVLQKYSQ